MNPISCKVYILGEQGTGVNSLVNRYIKNEFRENLEDIVGEQYNSKQLRIKNTNIKFDIWYGSGEKKFRTLKKLFYRDAGVVLFCYDLTNKDSLDEIKNYWVNSVIELNRDCLKYIVACKSDLWDNDIYLEEEGRAYAQQIGGKFFLTSSKDSTGVNELFNDVAKSFAGITDGEVVDKNANKNPANNNIKNVNKSGIIRGERKKCIIF